jgi:tetratricopeptide (TPR) repeat protein
MLKIKSVLNLLMFFLFCITILNAQTLEELLQEGDNYYTQYDNQKALESYQKADEMYPDNWEVSWRISRAYVDIGEHMQTNTGEEEDAQFAIYRLAKDYGNKAVSLAPEKSITFIRRAIAGGRIALFKGVFSVGSVVDSVRDDCLKAIELNNGGTYVQALSHYVLARTHAKLAEKPGIIRWPLGLGWGDIDVALEEFEKAIELDPDFIMFYLDYAKALVEEDEYDKAKEMLNKGLNCSLRDEDDKSKIEEMKQLLKDIEEKD